METKLHQDWDTASFDLGPVAPHTGPFVRRDLLNAWWRLRAGDGDLRLLDSGDALVPLCYWKDALRFVGEPDLTDYHSPLGSGASELITEYVVSLDEGTPIHLDSMPLEAATVVANGLEAAGLRGDLIQHETAAVLTLPGSYEDWLASLTRKDRHEVRRKLRRFESSGGSPQLLRRTGPEAVASFSAMHRTAHGTKGGFMTTEMESYFLSLHQRAGGVVDVLEGPDGVPVATAFGFEDDDAYYLYNSAYDPDARELSPGIVLLAALVAREIDRGATLLDFLKGDEPYKFRHGAVRRPLYEIRAIVGAAT